MFPFIRSKFLFSSLFFQFQIQGYVLELRKNPIPNPGQYWSLGKVEVEDVANKNEKATLTVSVKTLIERLEDAQEIGHSLDGLSIGITRSYIFEETDAAFCCSGVDRTKGCEGHELSITSPDNAYRSQTYSTTLTNASKSLHSWHVKQGSYTVFIANCAPEETEKVIQKVRLVGEIRLRHGHGYLSTSKLDESRVLFYTGFLYVILALLLAFYPHFGITTTPLCKCLVIFFSLCAIRLLFGSPYHEYHWNSSGIMSDGIIVYQIIAGLNLFAGIVFWDFLHSQYHINETCCTPMNKFDKLVLLLGGFVCLVVTYLLTNSMLEQTQIPEDFISSVTGANAHVTGGSLNNNTVTHHLNSGSGNSWDVFSITKLDTAQRYALLSIICLLGPLLYWSERRLNATESTNLSTMLVQPIRSKVNIVAITVVLLFILGEITSTQGKRSPIPLGNNDSLILESVILVCCSIVVYQIFLFNKVVSSAKYGTISTTEEIELSTIETEVNNYDPDKLPENRVIE